MAAPVHPPNSSPAGMIGWHWMAQVGINTVVRVAMSGTPAFLSALSKARKLLRVASVTSR